MVQHQVIRFGAADVDRRGADLENLILSCGIGDQKSRHRECILLLPPAVEK
jgi:hypothetical protein